MTRTLPAALLSIALVGRAAAGQTVDSVAGPAGAAGSERARRATRPVGPEWFLDLISVGGYDSNADGEPNGLASVGGAMGARGTFRSRADAPLLELTYEVGGHLHTPDSRWNRVSQAASAVVAYQLAGAWRAQVRLEATLSGSSEDRDLGDVYMIRPRLERRLTSEVALRLDGAYRIKRDAESSAKDAVNRYLAASVRLRPARRLALDLGVREERNAAVAERNRYARRTFGVTARGVAWGRDTVETAIKWQSKRYPARPVTIGNTVVAREDQRLTPSIGWMHPLALGSSIEAVYSFERRSSNDPDKGYVGHSVTLTMTRRW